MDARRVDPPLVAGERPTLEAYLDEQLRAASAPPSPISLLGLVRHLTEVERNWFQRVLEGRAIEGLSYTDAEPDGEFTVVGALDGAGIDGATGE